MSYDYVHTIRYMGNKGNILDFLIPEIENITEPGDIICDIMAGTNSIGYALKKRNIIYSNDIQYYSYVIANFMLGNHPIPSIDFCHDEIDSQFDINKIEKKYTFFQSNYTDTYFSGEQCEEIDCLRYAIDQAGENNRNYYLTLLMSAMCDAQSTTGHFAQYLDKDHRRVKVLRAMSIVDLFYKKMKSFDNFVISKYENRTFNLDYKDLFKLESMNDVKLFYLDSPYTSDQYSRFYHLLETVCKYDYPELSYKAKYRNDRIQSDFCYKGRVLSEFENIISFCKKHNAKLVISYSNHGVAAVEDIKTIAQKYYDKVNVKNLDFKHSSQGKGNIKINEVLFILD